MGRRALGGGGEHLDVGVGALWKIRHDGADWGQRTVDFNTGDALVLHKKAFVGTFCDLLARDNDCVHSPTEAACVLCRRRAQS